MSQRKRTEVWVTNQTQQGPPLNSTSVRDFLVKNQSSVLRYSHERWEKGREVAGLRPCKCKLYSCCWQSLERVGGEDIVAFPSFFSLSPSLFLFSTKCVEKLQLSSLGGKEHILKSQNFAGQENCSLPSSKEKPHHLQDLHMHTQETRLYLELISVTINELLSSLQNLCTLLSLLTLAVSSIFQAIRIVCCISFLAWLV